MDIRAYFHKVRALEQSIGNAWVVIVSEETSDGGKAGQVREVTRDVAAQLIVEGRARLANDAEVREYRADADRAKAEAEQERLSGRMQIAVMSDQEVRALKSNMRPKV